MVQDAIVLEFNELCPSLLDRFIESGALPNFASLRSRSRCFTTRTTDADVEPWVQWVTFHLGRRQDQHGIANLNEGHRVDAPALWDDLAAAGLRSLVFGAMNVAPSSSNLIDVVPDPWTNRVQGTTADLRQFHEFTTGVVQEHANPAKRAGVADILRAAPLLARLGVSPQTAAIGALQIAREVLSNRDRKWRRAAVFDRLSWDVFERQFLKRRPNLGIFFANSTAHYQHRYWRHMDPSAYAVAPSEKDLANYSGAVEFGYRQMDDLIGRAFRLARRKPGTAVVLATALSQHVNPQTKDTPGKVSYRPIDFATFLDWCGISTYVSVAPVMSSEAWLELSSESEADAVGQQLLGVALGDGRRVLHFEKHGNRLLFSCCLKEEIDPKATLISGGGRATAFGEQFSLIGKTMLDASHSREGVLWIASPGLPEERFHDALPLEDAKREILGLFGLATSAIRVDGMTLSRVA